MAWQNGDIRDVPDQQYRQVRRSILATFLERPRIYATDPFFETYERQARANLGDKIVELGD